MNTFWESMPPPLPPLLTGNYRDGADGLQHVPGLFDQNSRAVCNALVHDMDKDSTLLEELWGE